MITMIDSLYLGPEYDLSDIKGDTVNSMYVARLIEERNVVAIFQGRSEAGPRALGNRSILYDPRDPDGKDRINNIKRRESFRPFAGSVLLPHVHKWFDMGGLDESPFMMYAVDALPHTYDKIPAILHVDNTCRVQTVSYDQNPHFYNLIKSFYDITGVPVVGNTSFNYAGESIAETWDQVLATRKKMDITYLFLPDLNILVY